MPDYWVGDGDGRVLGPVALKTIEQLVARGRLVGLKLASRDGRAWVPLQEFPELHALLHKAPPPDPAADLTQEALRLRGLPLHEALGVRPGATLDEARRSYFAKVKQHHPAQLPAGSSAGLKQAHGEMFQALSDAMRAYEKQVVATKPGGASYQPEEFGWVRMPDATVRIDLDLDGTHAPLFTEVAQSNLDTGGFFLPCRQTLPLLQPVDVDLRFQSPQWRITSRGRVVCHVERSPIRHQQGVGIRLLSLSEDDRKFLRYFVKRYATTGPARPVMPPLK